MININALVCRLPLDSTYLWEKGTATLAQLLHSPWTKWGVAGVGAGFVGLAISHVRSRLAPLDQKVASNPNADQLVELFKELTPLKNHWFYAKRWIALKTYVENHNDLVEPFCEKLIVLQIADPKKDWLSLASELISFTQLSQILKVTEKDLTEYASDLAESLEKPPEKVESLGTDYAKTWGIYLAQALHSFASTFLRAHDFSSESNSLVERHEARWHLNNFYEMIEKPVMLILAIYTYLQPKTRFWWLPYVGCLCSAVTALSLIKFFSTFIDKKKPVFSLNFRNLSEEVEQDTLPRPVDCPRVADIANCLTPLDNYSLSVLLVGPPGVGKDMHVHSWVWALHDFPFLLQNKIEVLTTNASQLKEFGGGTSHTYLSRMDILKKEIKDKPHSTVFFLNEIHTVNPPKDQPGDVRNELGQQIKTDIETGKLHVIGATTLDEYRKHLEWDHPLMRRFTIIFLKEIPDCNKILETFMAEQYPLVTVDKAAITLALQETNKENKEICQPAKAKQLLAEAARSIISNFGEDEKELLTQSAQLIDERRTLKKDTTQRAKAKVVAALAKKVSQKESDLKAKRKELNDLTGLKHDRMRSNERLVTLAHRITSQPDKSDVEKTTFLLVEKLLQKLKTTIDDKETELEKKGIRIKVNEKLIIEILAQKKNENIPVPS